MFCNPISHKCNSSSRRCINNSFLASSFKICVIFIALLMVDFTNATTLSRESLKNHLRRGWRTLLASIARCPLRIHNF